MNIENVNKNEKRINYVDIAKGIGIILVLIGHISINNNINSIIYAFHMPLFFAISGFLYKEKKHFIKRKAKSILVPYFIFAILSYIYWFLIERKIRNQDENPLRLFFNIFIGCGGDENYLFNVSLWFLPCLFSTEIIYNILDKRVKNKTCFSIIIVFLSIIGYVYANVSAIRLPFSLDTALIAIIFYYFGILLKKIEDKKQISKFIVRSKKNKIISVMICVILLIVMVAINKFNGNINMNNLKINNYFLTLICSIGRNNNDNNF